MSATRPGLLLLKKWFDETNNRSFFKAFSLVPFSFKTQVCEIFVPHHKTVATYSKEQEACLNELSDSMDTIPQDVYFLHLVCLLKDIFIKRLYTNDVTFFSVLP